jgi:hypothetical protein
MVRKNPLIPSKRVSHLSRMLPEMTEAQSSVWQIETSELHEPK